MFTQLHNYGTNSINLTKHFMVSGGVEILKVVKFLLSLTHLCLHMWRHITIIDIKQRGKHSLNAKDYLSL